MKNSFILLVFTITVVLGFVSCDDDAVVFGDAKFIGEWSVIVLSQRIPAGSDSAYVLNESRCDYTFLVDGTMTLVCGSKTGTRDWYYREQPRKIILLDEQVIFFNVVEYDIVNCEMDSQEWEIRNISADGSTQLTTVKLTRK